MLSFHLTTASNESVRGLSLPPNRRRDLIGRLTLAGVLLTLSAGATQLFAAGPETTAAGKAGAYVRTLQNADGGFPDFAAASSPGATIDASFALAALGVDPTTVKRGGKSPADFLSAQASVYSASSAGAAAKLVLGVVTLNLNATSFGGINPLAVMEAAYTPASGQYGTDLFAQSDFILAEAALHRSVPAGAISYTKSLQHADGGWEDCCAFGEDTNTTALVIRALIGAGVPVGDPHIVSGLSYLKASQQADGGFPYAAPGNSDPDSTAFVIQAIVAAGQSAEAGGPWEKNVGKAPLGVMLTFQNQTNGALQFFGSDSAFATYQGIPGLMLNAFPERHAFTLETTATATSTVTPTLTSTATPTSTASTSTPVPPTATATVRPNATSTPVTPTAVSHAIGTPVRGVVGDVAVPTRSSSVLPSTRLPSTGSGLPPDRGSEPLLLLVGSALVLAGSFTITRRRR